MEPTNFQAAAAGILVGIIGLFLLVFIVCMIAEWWRTKPGHTKNEWAYGQQHIEVKFITGGGHRK